MVPGLQNNFLACLFLGHSGDLLPSILVRCQASDKNQNQDFEISLHWWDTLLHTTYSNEWWLIETYWSEGVNDQENTCHSAVKKTTYLMLYDCFSYL